MVVYHNLDDRDIVAGRCSDLIHVHAEAAVSGNVEHRGIRISHIAAGHLRSDGSTEAVAHGAKTAGSEKGSRLSVFVVLGSPHLVLANLGTDDSIAFGQLINRLHDKRAGKLGLIVAERVHVFHPLYVLDPLLMVHRVQTGIQLAQDNL